jgi:hypothetical protein
MLPGQKLRRMDWGEKKIGYACTVMVGITEG